THLCQDSPIVIRRLPTRTSGRPTPKPNDEAISPALLPNKKPLSDLERPIHLNPKGSAGQEVATCSMQNDHPKAGYGPIVTTLKDSILPVGKRGGKRNGKCLQLVEGWKRDRKQWGDLMLRAGRAIARSNRLERHRAILLFGLSRRML